MIDCTCVIFAPPAYFQYGRLQCFLVPLLEKTSCWLSSETPPAAGLQLQGPIEGSSFSPSSPSLISLLLRHCWVCFATEGDDRSAEWVCPCRCKGSTKWIHQACLQRWLDEKQKGNSMGSVSCPQCGTEYHIVFPKLGESAQSPLGTAWHQQMLATADA